jgi:hypothetical protein
LQPLTVCLQMTENLDLQDFAVDFLGKIDIKLESRIAPC